MNSILKNGNGRKITFLNTEPSQLIETSAGRYLSSVNSPNCLSDRSIPNLSHVHKEAFDSLAKQFKTTQIKSPNTASRVLKKRQEFDDILPSDTLSSNN